MFCSEHLPKNQPYEPIEEFYAPEPDEDDMHTTEPRQGINS